MGAAEGSTNLEAVREMLIPGVVARTKPEGLLSDVCINYREGSIRILMCLESNLRATRSFELDSVEIQSGAWKNVLLQRLDQTITELLAVKKL